MSLDQLKDVYDNVFNQAKDVVRSIPYDPRNEHLNHYYKGFGIDVPEYTPSAKRNLPPAEPAETGYAEGGMVGSPLTTYDPMQVDQIMNSINAPRNYAEGGSVTAYDSGRVDAILNQFM